MEVFAWMIMVFPTREGAPLEVREERGAGSCGVKVKRLKVGERDYPGGIMPTLSFLHSSFLIGCTPEKR